MVEKTFKTDLEAAKYMVQESGKSSWLLEKETTISRQQIDRWINGETKAIRNPTMQKLASALEYDISYHKQGITVSPHTKNITEDINMDEALLKDYIALQKEKIVALQDQIQELEYQKQNMDKMQDYDYENCMPTFCSVNELQIVPFRIKTISIDKTYMELNKYLQAPESVIKRAFEGDGNWHKWKDAPINELLSKQSSKYFIKASKNLKSLVETWKTFVVERTMAQRVDYAYKNNTVQTMVFTKLRFNKRKITTHSKSIMMEKI